jgi:hypothetical protein
VQPGVLASDADRVHRADEGALDQRQKRQGDGRERDERGRQNDGGGSLPDDREQQQRRDDQVADDQVK